MPDPAHCHERDSARDALHVCRMLLLLMHASTAVLAQLHHDGLWVQYGDASGKQACIPGLLCAAYHGCLFVFVWLSCVHI
jgi:hypothetical protein